MENLVLGMKCGKWIQEKCNQIKQVSLSLAKRLFVEDDLKK